MIFGDPADFAIEADVEPDLTPPSAVWGHMCVWCRGRRLGNIDELHCCLHHAARSLLWCAINLDALWSNELAAFNDIQQWNFLDGLLFGYHGEIALHHRLTLAELGAFSREFGKFIFLTNWGEQFDRCKSFLVCPPNSAVRVLYRQAPSFALEVAEVTREGFNSAAVGFHQWFHEQARRLAG